MLSFWYLVYRLRPSPELMPNLDPVPGSIFELSFHRNHSSFQISGPFNYMQAIIRLHYFFSNNFKPHIS